MCLRCWAGSRAETANQYLHVSGKRRRVAPNTGVSPYLFRILHVLV